MVALTRNVFLLYVATFFSYFGIAGFIPLLPIYLQNLGGTGSEIGFIFSLFFLTMVIFGAVFGAVIDLFGRLKELLLIGVIFTVISFYGIGISSSLNDIAFWRVVTGVGFSGFNTSATVTVTHFSKKYGKEIGDYSVIQALGLMTGYFTAGIFADIFGIGYAFQLISFLSLPAVFSVLLMKVPPLQKVEDVSFIRKVKSRLIPSNKQLLKAEILLLYTAYFCRTMTMSGWKAFVPIYLASLGATAVILGLIYAISVIPQLPISPVTGRLIDRFGPKKFIIASLLVTSFYVCMMPLIPNFWYGLILISLDGIAYVTLFVATSVYISRKISVEYRGEGIGFIYTVFGIGGLLGPSLSGLLVDLLGITSMMFLFSLIPIPVALLSIKYLSDDIEK